MLLIRWLNQPSITQKRESNTSVSKWKILPSPDAADFKTHWTDSRMGLPHPTKERRVSVVVFDINELGDVDVGMQP